MNTHTHTHTNTHTHTHTYIYIYIYILYSTSSCSWRLLLTCCNTSLICISLPTQQKPGKWSKTHGFEFWLCESSYVEISFLKLKVKLTEGALLLITSDDGHQKMIKPLMGLRTYDIQYYIYIYKLISLIASKILFLT